MFTNYDILPLLGILNDTPEALKQRVGYNFNNQLAFIEGMLPSLPSFCHALSSTHLFGIAGMRAVIGHDPDFNPRFIDKRDFLGGKFIKLSNNKIVIPKNITTIQYLIWGHGVSYATFKRWKAEEFKLTKHIPKHTGKSVLTDAAFTQTLYTPQRMYLNVTMAEW
jgi:hypothetical protein